MLICDVNVDDFYGNYAYIGINISTIYKDGASTRGISVTTELL